MTVLAIVLAGIIAGAVALAATMAALAVRNGSRASDARVEAADLRGDVKIASIELDRAASTIAATNRARLRAAARADALELELHELENQYVDPAARAGRARLRAALQAAADDDDLAAAGYGRPDRAVPDEPSAEPASVPGD